MTKNEPLTVKKREVSGTKACRRLRVAGEVPAIIYGHAKETVAIQVPAEELHQALRQHSRMFDVRLGRKKESVLLRDIQYDAFGDVILHADFVRVAMDEALQIKIPIRLKGSPKVEHAVLQQTLDTLEVECLPSDIPEGIVVPVADMQLNESITIQDVKVPDAIKILTDPETVVATLTLVAAMAGEEPEAVAAASEEPEVIGREDEAEGEGAAEDEAK